MSGIEKITEERNKQLAQWFESHDDEHDQRQLILAALSYILAAIQHHGEPYPEDWWPWDLSSYKPRTVEENLIRAGALIAAELDRLDRIQK